MAWPLLEAFEAGAAAMAVALAVMSLIPPIRDHASKFAGIFLVTLLALLADSVWVYGVTIFVVATVITKLEFLENLAAISWDRPWWRKERATGEDLARKTKTETVLARQKPSTEKEASEANRPRYDPADFEKRALASLGLGLFSTSDVETGIRLVSRSGTRIVVDAIAHGPVEDYVVEVKSSTTELAVQHGVFGLMRAISAYETFRPRADYPVRGLFVVPPGADVPHVPDRVMVLHFDPSLGKFLEHEDALLWINHASG